MRASLLASAALLLTSPAGASGLDLRLSGSGGEGVGGAAGGYANPVGAGGNGTDGGTGSESGGGGGSGVSGGSGGKGGDAGGAGGAGGTVSGANGEAGTSGKTGGGGGGGAHGYYGTLEDLASPTYTGGAGGAGAAGGGGGGGGYGGVVGTGGGSSSIANDFIGGAGGMGANEGGSGGGGGGGLLILGVGADASVTFGAEASAAGGAGGAGVGAYSMGGTGGAGLLIGATTSAPVTVTVEGAVTSGNGGAVLGNQSVGGQGGTGIYVASYPNFGTLTVNVKSAIVGGTGGSAFGGTSLHGGTGGIGIFIGSEGGVSPISYVNVSANVTGGTGGGADMSGTAGSGGTGILGMMSYITVAGGVTVSGGAGAAGTNGAANGTGGVGIGGSNIAVSLEGTAKVQGGLGGDGVTQAAAIAFGSGYNTLELRADASGNLPTLVGGVTHYGNTDILALGGAHDKTITATSLADYAVGFGSLTKIGTSTWTLTGDFASSALSWTLAAGTLSISADVNLGSINAGVTFGGGTLLTTESTASGRLYTVGTDGGTFSVANGKTLTLLTGLAGSGALTKSGDGILTLTASKSSFSGAFIIDAGTLALSGAGSLGNASGLIIGKGTFDIADTTAGATVKNLSGTDADGKVFLGARTLTVNSPGATSFAGVISGTGGVTLASGDFTLTGANTYSGTTEVQAGGLYIGNGGTTGSVAGPILLTGSGTLNFNRSDSYTITNSITGAAGTAIGFMGGGTFSYTGPGLFTGFVAVSDATLVLNGTEFASTSSVEAYAGGVIGGTGTVINLIAHDGGTVAPGNSPGTLITNKLTFEAGSIYRVDVTPSGAHDLITVTDTASIAPTAYVQLVAAPGSYKPTETYAIITATNGVTGTFDRVEENYAFLDGALSYDPTNVFLTLTYTGASFATYARTPNQLGTAVAAQALGDGNAIYDALLLLPENAVPAAFDALSGEAYASVSSVLQQQSIYVRDAVSGRLRQALTAPGVSALAYGPGPVKAPLAEGYAPTLWAQGYGGWGNTNGNGNAATISNTIGGFLMGADVSVAENARAGLFGGYSRSTFDVDGRSSSGSANNVDLGLYAGAQFGAVALRGGAAYTWHDLSMSRSVVFPGFAESLKGSDTTGTAQVFGEIGYDVEVGAIAFEPFLGLAYVNVSGASLGEEGGAAALSVSTDDMSTFYSTLGVRLATTVEVGGRTLTPYATLGWQHAFGDVTPTASNQFAGGLTPFSVSGVPVAEDALLVEAGLSYALSPNAQIGATYAGQLAGDASQNAFTAQFSLRF